jgi:hypothetical protein
MKNLPPELVYGLIFVAILLFQYLTRKSRQQDQLQQESAPDEDLPQFAEEMEETTAAVTPGVSAGHFGRTPAPSASDTPARRRFSRTSLMGSRRAMQNAVVIATILGPCRAFEQHDIR